MATFEVRRRSDGSIRYRARVRLKGERCVSATFLRKTDAARWAQRAESEARSGRYFQHEHALHHTVAELLDRYVEEVLPRKPRTAPFQARQLAWWKAQLGDLKLVDLTARKISEARAELMRLPGETGRRRGPSTANRYIALLSHALSVAQREWEWIDFNPAKRLKNFRESRGREVFLSEDECAALLEASRKADPRLHLAVLIALSTGMRRNEILTLQASQVDVEHRFVYLDDTKNGERRGVPLAGAALDAVKARLGEVNGPNDLLFAGAKPTTPFDIRKPWYRAIASVGLQHVRFHDLRHTAASHLAKGGASLPTIGAILGHKSPVMTKRYAHFAQAHLLDVVEAMNNRVFKQR